MEPQAMLLMMLERILSLYHIHPRTCITKPIDGLAKLLVWVKPYKPPMSPNCYPCGIIHTTCPNTHPLKQNISVEQN